MNTEETIVWKGSPSQWTNFGTYLLCLILAAGIVAAYFLTAIGPLVLAGLAVPVLWALGVSLGTRFNTYEITTERIIVTTGVLTRRRTELELYRVRDYQTIEPFALRLVGRGNLQLVTSDRTTPSLFLHAVPDVIALKDKIRANTETMRHRRGVRDLEINPAPDVPPLNSN
ncbi:PH domain-containing protein [Oleiharenicola lentus]|uniref:PH domain-containing protein n=1 Tax=Oleiharenicola lentus TaxID=2508720 RepID=UPI003F670901